MATKSQSMAIGYPANESCVARIHFLQGNRDEAERLLVNVIERTPEAVDGHAWLAYMLNYLGRSGEALAMAEKALEIAPANPVALGALGHAHRLTCNLQQALATQQQLPPRESGFIYAFHAQLEKIILYQQMEREDEALAEVAAFMELSPNFSAELWVQRLPYTDPSLTESDLAALNKAGLK